jgi:uncharacterized membrane protein HdeD (DUF308 family)
MLRVVEASRSRQTGGIVLVKDWSTMAARGSLSIGLGLAVLLWPAPRLGELVVLFGIYALLDGIAAAAWAVRVSRRSLGDWPLLLAEAVFSVGLGVAALGFPLQSALFVQVVALWGFVTGTLEVLSALVLARRGAAAHWFLVAAGAWSLFLAVLVLSLPHALTQSLVIAIGVYALVFGVLVSLAAFRLRRVVPQMPMATVRHA